MFHDRQPNDLIITATRCTNVFLELNRAQVNAVELLPSLIHTPLSRKSRADSFGDKIIK
ncbi:hypothetical protein HCH_04351 [Hahella chejuensis KCTC 2396]|uniref:Uncharacterized protein n=1 Tax=Hahella chejuensis (strain KCTC 2396) TaxID=349521 RepID=Q2SE67_HAHCH|nr:hypothetical protein HCH_04351 [Hahella chejuensis KCTC 2396]